MAKRKHALYLKCDCLDDTCGNLRFVQDEDGLIQIDYLTSTKREGRLGRALKVMFHILLGREYPLWGIVVSKNNQIQKLKDFVARANYTNE